MKQMERKTMLKLTKFMMLSALFFVPVLAYADLSLKDFKGSYITTIMTTGGSPNSEPLAAGITTSAVRQISIDSHGNGTVNFESQLDFVGFSGAAGNATAISTNDGTASPRSFTVHITDKKRGCGQIILKSLDGKTNTLSDFVVIQGDDGKVVKFIQNIIDNPTTGAFHIVNERQ
jgi:hypothetical protein